MAHERGKAAPRSLPGPAAVTGPLRADGGRRGGSTRPQAPALPPSQGACGVGHPFRLPDPFIAPTMAGEACSRAV
jgi:hypothetical protein